MSGIFNHTLRGVILERRKEGHGEEAMDLAPFNGFAYSKNRATSNVQIPQQVVRAINGS
jgi:hypothetical protein